MDDDDIWKRDEVDSPCVQLCVMHPTAELCMGCFRTVDEIANWSRMDPDKRKSLMVDLPNRKNLVINQRKRRRQT
jgi:predicted Fe-S protein YdhL (DUF1289 family)